VRVGKYHGRYRYELGSINALSQTSNTCTSQVKHRLIEVRCSFTEAYILWLTFHDSTRRTGQQLLQLMLLRAVGCVATTIATIWIFRIFAWNAYSGPKNGGFGGLWTSVRVVNEKERERRAPKALRRLTSGEGVSPSLVGKQIEEGSCAPSPEIFLIFLSDTGAFWCILGVCFNFSIRRVKQSRKAVLCANCQLVSCLTWRTYHPWYHTNKHYCLHAWTQEAS